MSKTYALDVQDLHKSFGDKHVIRGVSFRVEHGDIFGFLGPNGSGKTTLIRMILNLVHPDRGRVLINGYDTRTRFLQAIASVGAVVESPSLYLHLTARQNLKLIANLHPELPVERIDEILDLVGLSGRGDEKVKNYSLGMKQRLGIAQALIHNPNLVFLDEPTNGIDPQGVIEIRELITRLARDHGITFFITTHQLHEVEQICNRVAILKNGHVIEEGFVEDLLNREEDEVEVVTRDRDRAMAIIEKQPYVKDVSRASDRLKVRVEQGTTGQLNRELITQGITVDYLVPVRTTLEHYFIERTEGEAHAVPVDQK
ncbi:MAG: ABC transporter ATP-binding protein [Bacillaceae bacterium]|nr:ABC transporter ATP-binding protein [Bacillaceae bacterium]